MNAERWAQVKAIFGEAMEKPVSQRGGFLDSVCASDPELRAEVESLLAAGGGTQSLPRVRDGIASGIKALVSDQSSRMAGVLDEELGGKYEIIRLLGEGGMGEVYLARENALDRLVAIKVMRPELAEAPESQVRFRREARIAAQLTHPGILRLHTFGEAGDLRYFVMAYVPGQTLAERLRLEGRLPWYEARRILAELADALECAHAQGVIHRDIKPANVLLDENSGRAVLADFGISKNVSFGDSLTATGAVVGTPDFMSPEQSLGSSEIDHRSDIYSLGAVGYMMLCGRSPFAGRAIEQTVYSRLLQDPTPLDSRAPGAPRSLSAAIMKCLEREPVRRWQDMRAFRNALDLSQDASDAVPDALRDLPAFAPYAILWALAWLAIATLTSRSIGERWMLALIAMLVPAGLALHVWHVGGRGYPFSQLVKVASWPPEWWGMWWPASLRRPTDVWARLPLPARAVRITLSAFLVGAPALIGLRQWLEASGRASASVTGMGWFAIAQSGALLVTALSVALGIVWSRGNGLSLSDTTRLLIGGTAESPFWSVPSVARLLASAGSRVRQPDPENPSDYRRGIQQIVGILPGAAAKAGAAALETAELLLSAIHRAELELGELDRSAGASEVERLSSQLAALDHTKYRDPEHARLRELVESQLRIVRALRERHRATLDRRATLFAQLRGLWSQLNVLYVDSSELKEGGTAAAEAAHRILALCADVRTDAAQVRPRRSHGISPRDSDAD